MKIKVPTFAAVVLFALVWLYFGINHLVNADTLASMASTVPGGTFWIYFTGACMILAGISMIWGKWTRPACYLLALMLLIFIVVIHIPALNKGNVYAPFNILKDLGLLAASVVIGNVRHRIREL
ncbi:DoxX family protein [Chitinophaga sp. GCM10012297]|uniref:DoxX family membrane protein n=1 Tax=Chitinophaga chungangae TaxID=2821488 RepID=A0ABS3YEP1_9BACT|nr:DoxX family membrane protein [Chitinophaga chungangae]MBO9153151.1 DoxX family membrane protein [Chitinophaga chungangae]